MTVKHIDTYGKNWKVAFVGVISFGYCIFLLPLHVPMAIFTAFNYHDLMNSRFLSDKLITILFLSAPIPIVEIIYSIRKQRKNIRAFTSFFRESELCAPSPQNIAMNRTGYSYLGLDTKKGTLLYINHPETTIFNFFFPRDVRVMGFGMYDWKSIEVEGNTLRIFTGNPELPSVSIVTSKASQLLEKINVMRNQNWSYEYNIPGCVEIQAQKIAEKNGINLVLPPK